MTIIMGRYQGPPPTTGDRQQTGLDIREGDGRGRGEPTAEDLRIAFTDSHRRSTSPIKNGDPQVVGEHVSMTLCCPLYETYSTRL